MLAVIKGSVTAGGVCNTRTPRVTLLAAPMASLSQSRPEFLFVPKTDSPCEHRNKHPDPELPHPGSVSGHEQFPGLRGSFQRQVMLWTRNDAFMATGIRATRGQKGPNNIEKAAVTLPISG